MKMSHHLLSWAELSLGGKAFPPPTYSSTIEWHDFHSMEKAKILKFYWKECIPETLPSKTKWGKAWSQ